MGVPPPPPQSSHSCPLLGCPCPTAGAERTCSPALLPAATPTPSAVRPPRGIRTRPQTQPPTAPMHPSRPPGPPLPTPPHVEQGRGDTAGTPPGAQDTHLSSGRGAGGWQASPSQCPEGSWSEGPGALTGRPRRPPYGFSVDQTAGRGAGHTQRPPGQLCHGHAPAGQAGPRPTPQAWGAGGDTDFTHGVGEQLGGVMRSWAPGTAMQLLAWSRGVRGQGGVCMGGRHRVQLNALGGRQGWLLRLLLCLQVTASPSQSCSSKMGTIPATRRCPQAGEAGVAAGRGCPTEHGRRSVGVGASRPALRAASHLQLLVVCLKLTFTLAPGLPG